ncbi:MAG: molecular chaperone [Sphingobacteriales bacterium]|jgi:P pilus assembly chaperone PapD|uniref:fimbrial biogenesis chaperone n=1 Tax=Pseudomonas plecoglossicida TaxID=70775 RepID=UPI0010E12358|nr:molecular chaperone [Pseudomonas plecoglossicida]MBA1198611.1 molecular chaperone [Pseudomonas plecoglossicida]RYD98022.1 MAG: molecular chaperone [Sphingobacteriales bacterium]
MKRTLLALATAVLCLSSVVAHAGVNVGATRVIYQGKDKEANLSVTNTVDDQIPYLIQSWVSEYGGGDDTSEKFIITPPLFRLDPGSQNMLRILAVQANQLPTDKESLFSVNVKAIPAKNNDPAKQNVLQIAIKTSIKLFYRPEGLSGSLIEAAKGMAWSSENGSLTFANPSGYHIVVSKLLINGVEQKGMPDVIAPGQRGSVSIPAKAGDSLTLSYINEYGSAVDAPATTLPHR